MIPPAVPLPPTVPARWLRRHSRFHGDAEVGGAERTVRVPGPGRMRELLRPGALVRVTPWREPDRYRTWGTVHLVRGPGGWVPVDALLPNRLVAAALGAGAIKGLTGPVTAEPPFGSGRADFIVGGTVVEVKGVTLLDDQAVARFPDSPTARGRRQLRELRYHVGGGGSGMVLFVVLVAGAVALGPAWAIDPEFAAELRVAADSGVKIAAVGVDTTLTETAFHGAVPLTWEVRQSAGPEAEIHV